MKVKNNEKIVIICENEKKNKRNVLCYVNIWNNI